MILGEKVVVFSDLFCHFVNLLSFARMSQDNKYFLSLIEESIKIFISVNLCKKWDL